MNLIDQQIRKIKQEKRLGLMTHVVVGYPSLSKTESIIKTMTKAGVDFIELQIPFSDPLADGPTIMRACEQSLTNGTKVKDAFILAHRLSRQIKIPLLFMSYYNIVFKYGTKDFCKDAKSAGISGLIVPDVSLEEESQEHFIKYCKKSGLKNIRIVSPVSTIERLKKNSKAASGFLYCAARQGITGAKKDLDPNIAAFLKKARNYFNIPLAVGFGISKKEHLKKLSSYADIAVIGSAIIDVINKSNKNNVENNIKNFLARIVQYLTFVNTVNIILYYMNTVSRNSFWFYFYFTPSGRS